MDSDEKVVGNAICSVGHIVCLSLASCVFQGDDCSLAYAKEVLTCLKRKLDYVMELPIRANSLTWKQRSFVKRHGWGAVYAVAQMFKELKARKNVCTVDIFEPITRSLYEAMLQLDQLPPKVAVAVTSAFLEVDLGFVQTALSDCQGCLAKIILSVLPILLNEVAGHRERPAVETLVLRLLPKLSLLEAKAILQSGDLVPLIEWMMSNECSGDVYKTFTAALRTTSVDFETQRLLIRLALGNAHLESIDEL